MVTKSCTLIMSFEETSVVKSHTFLAGVNDLLSVYCTFIVHFSTANRKLVFERMNSVHFVEIFELHTLSRLCV